MSESKKKTGGAAPKKAAAPADVNTVVKVRNISGGLINTKSGPIDAGEKGKATIGELRSYSGYLEQA